MFGRYICTGSGAIANPALLLSLDLYQRPDYPGAILIWPGTATAGTSGSHFCPAATNQAIQGTAVNGRIPARFGSGHTSSGADGSLDDYITASAFSGAILFNATSASSDNIGFPYLNSQIMADGVNALFGCSFSVNGVDVWMYDGTWQRVQFSCPTGQWHVIQFYYDGTNLHARLDGGSWSSTTVAAGFSGFDLTTQTLRLGSAPYSATSYAGDILECFLSKTQLLLTDFDDYYAFLQAYYPSAALP